MPSLEASTLLLRSVQTKTPRRYTVPSPLLSLTDYATPDEHNIEFSCPACRAMTIVDEVLAGAIVTCPQCRESVTVTLATNPVVESPRTSPAVVEAVTEPIIPLA